MNSPVTQINISIFHLRINHFPHNQANKINYPPTTESSLIINYQTTNKPNKLATPPPLNSQNRLITPTAVTSQFPPPLLPLINSSTRGLKLKATGPLSHSLARYFFSLIPNIRSSPGAPLIYWRDEGHREVTDARAGRT